MNKKTLFYFSLFLTLMFSHSAWGECIELKNDQFKENAAGQSVSAIRSFCVSEFFGSVFKAPQDVTLDKIRILLSGSGQPTTEGFALHMRIYEDKGQLQVNESTGKKSETTGLTLPLNSLNSNKPQWMEIKDVGVNIKKGESFRVVFGHDPHTCQVPPPKATCANTCNWWSGTSDAKTMKPKTNVVLGSLFGCDALKTKPRKWHYWESLPASCQPKGNVIIRILAWTGSGKTCKQGTGGGICQPGDTKECVCGGGKKGVSTCNATGSAWGPCEKCGGGTGGKCTPGQTQQCSCGTGQVGIQTCNATGTAWGTCENCKAGSNCTPGKTQVCACAGGKAGVQTCKANGSGWDTCQCGKTNVCAPGANQQCPCLGGKVGLQSCKTDGSGWGVCQCGGNVDNKPKAACTAGATQQCACVAGGQGVQRCSDDGSKWENCICQQGCGCGPETDPESPLNSQLWLLFLVGYILLRFRTRVRRTA